VGSREEEMRPEPYPQHDTGLVASNAETHW